MGRVPLLEGVIAEINPKNSSIRYITWYMALFCLFVVHLRRRKYPAEGAKYYKRADTKNTIHRIYWNSCFGQFSSGFRPTYSNQLKANYEFWGESLLPGMDSDFEVSKRHGEQFALSYLTVPEINCLNHSCCSCTKHLLPKSSSMGFFHTVHSLLRACLTNFVRT